jgi:hypothetical protein
LGFTVINRLPGSLSDARNLALIGKFAEADTAYAVFAEISVRTAADLATVISSRRELRSGLLSDDH